MITEDIVNDLEDVGRVEMIHNVKIDKNVKNVTNVKKVKSMWSTWLNPKQRDEISSNKFEQQLNL